MSEKATALQRLALLRTFVGSAETAEREIAEILNDVGLTVDSWGIQPLPIVEGP